MKRILLLLLIIATLTSCTWSIQEKQMEKARDSLRMSDLNLLNSALSIYHWDNDTYPANINDLVDITKIVLQDPRHWETIKWNIFQYKYETTKDNSGNIVNYRLSTYLESSLNTKHALEDQGIYDDKFEIFK